MPDQCIYLEACPGDQGQNKGSNPGCPQWWLSSDITLTSSTGQPDQAVEGQPNTATVKGHWAPNCALPLDTTIFVELWVATPHMNMSPSPSTSHNITTTTLSGLTPGSSATVTIPWTPTPANPNDPNDPQSAGHKCLVARCYPITSPVDSTDFHLPGELHVAQHNIAVVAAAGAREGRPFRFNVSTVNLNDKQPEPATIRAVADPNPDEHVREVVNARLQQVPGFRRIATSPPPQGFKVETPDFPNAKVYDYTRLGCFGILLSFLLFLLSILGIKLRPFQPRYETQIQMQPGQHTTFTFVTDLSQAQVGDAYIFHFTHVGADQKETGGFTVVPVVI